MQWLQHSSAPLIERRSVAQPRCPPTHLGFCSRQSSMSLRSSSGHSSGTLWWWTKQHQQASQWRRGELACKERQAAPGAPSQLCAALKEGLLLGRQRREARSTQPALHFALSPQAHLTSRSWPRMGVCPVEISHSTTPAGMGGAEGACLHTQLRWAPRPLPCFLLL